METYIHCFQAQEKLGKTTDASCHDGSVRIKFIHNDADVEYGKREYQRERVADEEFKQEVILTILIRPYCRIPEIHIRVIKLSENTFIFELVDGQQRVTSVTDFLDGKFPLPKDVVINGVDVGGLYANQLKKKHTKIYETILNYRISCKWYENLTDIQTAELFVEILNKTNDMKAQEIRNAISGDYSTWVRDTARGYMEEGIKPHKLFVKSSDDKPTLKHFGKFVLKGRMEIDEWLSEFVYMYINGWKNGVTQAPHTKWVKSIQRPGGVYENKFTDKSKMEKLPNFAFEIIKSVPKEYKLKLTPMLSHILVLYAIDLKNRYGKLIPSKYTKSFFKVYDDWSCDKKKLYIDRTTMNGNQLGQFNTLFGGRNANAIGTICMILDEEVEKDIDSFGIIEIDPRESFTDEEIYKKWKEQGMKDGYTDLPLEFEEAVGDHYIPRSEGIKLGGVTEYHNLVVTADVNNRYKSNMSPESFKQQVA